MFNIFTLSIYNHYQFTNTQKKIYIQYTHNIVTDKNLSQIDRGGEHTNDPDLKTSHKDIEREEITKVK